MRWLESWLVTFAVLLYGGAVLPLLPGGVPDPREQAAGSAVAQGLFGATYALALVRLLTRPRRSLRIAGRSKWLWAMVGLAPLSTVWSIAPDITARRSAALLGTTLFGLYLAVRVEPAQLFRILSRSVTLVVLATLSLVLVAPSVGVMTGFHEGAWRGPMVNKNALGRLMVLGGVVYYLRSLDAPQLRRWLLRLGVAACVALVILSRSATALVVGGAMALIVLPVSRALRTNVRLMLPVALVASLVVTAAASWALENQALILAALGREETMTGRTLLWGVTLDYAAQRPLVGYGYSGFWVVAAGRLWQAVGWDAPHAHNGLLDLWLGLGGVGVALFLAGSLALLVRAVRRLRADPSPAARWPLVYLSFVLAYSVTESDLFRHNSLLWVLFAAVALSPDVGYVGPRADPTPDRRTGHRVAHPLPQT